MKRIWLPDRVHLYQEDNVTKGHHAGRTSSGITGLHLNTYTTLPPCTQHYRHIHNTTATYTTLPPHTQNYHHIHNTTATYTTLPPHTQHYHHINHTYIMSTTITYTTLPPSKPHLHHVHYHQDTTYNRRHSHCEFRFTYDPDSREHSKKHEDYEH